MILTMKDVARLLKIKAYRIDYVLGIGVVEEPELRAGNRRIFQQQDVERLAKHFGVKIDDCQQTRVLEAAI